MESRSSPFLISVLCLGIAFLYLPMAVLVGYSFNASAMASVWGGFSTHWYTELLQNRQILGAARLSLEIAVLSSTGALLLGTLAAVALVRFAKFRGCCKKPNVAATRFIRPGRAARPAAAAGFGSPCDMKLIIYKK